MPAKPYPTKDDFPFLFLFGGAALGWLYLFLGWIPVAVYAAVLIPIPWFIPTGKRQTDSGDLAAVLLLPALLIAVLGSIPAMILTIFTVGGAGRLLSCSALLLVATGFLVNYQRRPKHAAAVVAAAALLAWLMLRPVRRAWVAHPPWLDMIAQARDNLRNPREHLGWKTKFPKTEAE
jgi:hypothetical protein